MKVTIGVIKSLVLGVGLGVSAFEDFRTKKLSSLPIFLTGLAGIILTAVGGEYKNWNLLFRLIPGALVFLAAWSTKESIGYGDAWIILELGCFLPVEEILSVCMAAITIAAFTALLLIVAGHKKGKTQIPFVPFLFGAYILQMYVVGL